MKTAKTFRLSEQAVKRLQTLKEHTGTNETAILEIALALFEGSIITGTFGGVPLRQQGVATNVPDDPNSLIEQAEQEELFKQFPALKGMQPVMISPNRKKRKRKK